MEKRRFVYYQPNAKDIKDQCGVIIKNYKIVYHLYPYDDVVIVIEANNEDDAIAYAKRYRKDSFSIYETE